MQLDFVKIGRDSGHSPSVYCSHFHFAKKETETWGGVSGWKAESNGDSRVSILLLQVGPAVP